MPLALVIALAVVGDPSGTGRTLVQRPRLLPSGGWLLGLAVVTAVFKVASGGLSNIATYGYVVALSAGTSIVFSALRWLTRHRHTEMPGWMRRAFASFTGTRRIRGRAGGGEA